MKRKKFWKLSFYEWSLWSLRIADQVEKRIEDKKFLARLARRMMHANAKSMGAKNVKDSDFWQLPEDNEEEGGKEYTQEEFDEKFEKALKVQAKVKARKPPKAKKKNG